MAGGGGRNYGRSEIEFADIDARNGCGSHRTDDEMRIQAVVEAPTKGSRCSGKRADGTIGLVGYDCERVHDVGQLGIDV